LGLKLLKSRGRGEVEASKGTDEKRETFRTGNPKRIVHAKEGHGFLVRSKRAYTKPRGKK